jgi:hypothetical protein
MGAAVTLYVAFSVLAMMNVITGDCGMVGVKHLLNDLDCHLYI